MMNFIPFSNNNSVPLLFGPITNGVVDKQSSAKFANFAGQCLLRLVFGSGVLPIYAYRFVHAGNHIFLTIIQNRLERIIIFYSNRNADTVASLVLDRQAC